jgi:hypothetical protein
MMAAPKLFPVILVAPLMLGIVFSVAMAPYFASGADPDDNVRRLHIRYTTYEDPEAPISKSLFNFLARASANSHSLPGFEFVSPAAFSKSELEDLVNIGSEEVWATIWVNEGASSSLLQALQFPNASMGYKAASAIQFTWDEGRNNIVTSPRVAGPVRSLLSTFSTLFANFSNSHLLSQGADALAFVATYRPDLLATPISYTERNLHPVLIPVAQNALTVGNIVMVVFSMASCLVVFKALIPALMTYSPPRRTIAILLCLGAVPAVVAGCYATIIAGLAGEHLPNGGVSWAQLWATQWLHMLTYVYFFAAVGTFLVPDAIPLFMLFVLVYNALGGWNTELADFGYHFFWYTPMHHAANVIRYVLFGSLSTKLGTAIGVLFAWAVFGVLLMLLATLRRASLAKQKASAASAIAPTIEMTQQQAAEDEDKVVGVVSPVEEVQNPEASA